MLTGGALEGLGPLPEWVDVRGLVSRSELLASVPEAACLAFPSLYEGFGLPPLEAMASAARSRPRSWALYPRCAAMLRSSSTRRTPTPITDGVLRALDDSEALVPRGLARAEQFAWQRCVDQHVEVYRKVASAQLTWLSAGAGDPDGAPADLTAGGIGCPTHGQVPQSEPASAPQPAGERRLTCWASVTEFFAPRPSGSPHAIGTPPPPPASRRTSPSRREP